MGTFDLGTQHETMNRLIALSLVLAVAAVNAEPAKHRFGGHGFGGHHGGHVSHHGGFKGGFGGHHGGHVSHHGGFSSHGKFRGKREADPEPANKFGHGGFSHGGGHGGFRSHGGGHGGFRS